VKDGVGVTKRPGIKAVAERAGVSVGTVSNVLNRPEQVSAAVRRRVAMAMAELGFVRNSSASTLKAGRSRSLGLVVLDIGNPFFTAVARGVEQTARERGYAVLLCNSDESHLRQDDLLTFLEEQRVAGVLITPVDGDRSRLDLLRSRGTAVVTVDEPSSGGYCSVAVDDVRGGAAAAQHLLATGRRRIVYVTGPDTIRQCAERGVGLRQAIVASGGDPSEDLRHVVIPALNGGRGHRAVAEFLADRQPDAVFCANDVVALGVLRGLLEAGVSVPADVALVGYDDIEFAATAAVPLTSVRQPARQVGRTAAALLLEEVSHPGDHAHRQVMFRPELIIRQSSGG